MKYGVLGLNLKDGTEAWCLRNGEPIAFSFSYEADYFAKSMGRASLSPDVRCQTRVLPPEWEAPTAEEA